jgi:hypothetical protein
MSWPRGFLHQGSEGDNELHYTDLNVRRPTSIHGDKDHCIRQIWQSNALITMSFMRFDSRFEVCVIFSHLYPYSV